MPSERSSTLPPKPRAAKKHFTLAEANRALPYVARVVADIVVAYQAATALKHRCERPQPGDDDRRLQRDFDQSLRRLQELNDELAATGVELKDFETGLIDFPALHEGREILLCWKLHEEAILAWHEVHAGFAGRQDLSKLEG